MAADEHGDGAVAAGPTHCDPVDELEVGTLAVRDPRSVESPASLLAVVADRNRDQHAGLPADAHRPEMIPAAERPERPPHRWTGGTTAGRQLAREGSTPGIPNRCPTSLRPPSSGGRP